MIKLIYGGQGSGKTAKLIEEANTAVDSAKGIHVYIDKSNSRMHDLNHSVKLVDATEYGVCSIKEFLAFIYGITAGNYDIEKIYIDNLEKILHTTLDNTEEFFDGLEKASVKTGVQFVVTVLGEKDQLPVFLSKLA